MVKLDSLYPSVCLYSFGDSGLPCDLSHLMDLGRIVAFQPVFLAVKNGHDDFQGPCIPDKKLEVTFL